MPNIKLENILECRLPHQWQTALVIDSPHSGREYPSDFNHNACALTALRKAEDPWLDEVFEHVLKGLDIPFLHALFPRSYVDVNRADHVTERFKAPNVKGDEEYLPTKSGLIRSHISPIYDDPIYHRKMSLKEAFHRVAEYYHPYHNTLERMLDNTHKIHGRVVHLNMHSMPSMLKKGTVQNPHHFILGTMGGKTTDDKYVQKLKTLLEQRGYKVGLNVRGFRGREIVARHSDPQNHRHCIQVEINRRLYVQEHSLALGPGWGTLIAELKGVIKEFQEFVDQQPRPQPKNIPAPKVPKSPRH